MRTKSLDLVSRTVHSLEATPVLLPLSLYPGKAGSALRWRAGISPLLEFLNASHDAQVDGSKSVACLPAGIAGVGSGKTAVEARRIPAVPAVVRSNSLKQLIPV